MRNIHRKNRLYGLRLLAFVLLTLTLVVPQPFMPTTTPVAMAATYNITGTVTACSAPAAGVIVQIYDSSNPVKVATQTGTTGANGSFTITNFDDTGLTYPLRIVASLAGYRTTIIFTQNTAPAGDIDTGTDDLENATFKFTGNVKESGTPPQNLAGAIVELTVTPDGVYSGPTSKAKATTDANGNYEVVQYMQGTGTPPVNYNYGGTYIFTLKVRKDGYVRQSRVAYKSPFMGNFPPSCSQGSLSNEYFSMSHSQGTDFSLNPGHTFVIDGFKDSKENKAITDVSGRFVPYEEAENFGSYYSINQDSDGKYRVELAPQWWGTWNWPIKRRIRMEDITMENITGYAKQFLKDSAGVQTFKEATEYTLAKGGTTNLGTVLLTKGSKITGKLYDSNKTPLKGVGSNTIYAYDTDGNALDDFSVTPDATGTYATQSTLFPGPTLLGWNGGDDSGFSRIDNSTTPPTTYSYINHFWSTSVGAPGKEDYYLGTSDPVTIPNDNSTKTGVDWYFESCAEVSGKLKKPDGSPLGWTPFTDTAPDPDRTYNGDGSFTMEWYDGVTGNSLFSTDPDVLTGATYQKQICHTSVATLGKFQWKISPPTINQPVAAKSPPPAEQRDFAFSVWVNNIKYYWEWGIFTDYKDWYQPFWYGSNVYSQKDAKVVSVKPGDKLVNDFTFEEGGQVEGVVQNEKGESFEGVDVWLDDPTKTTDKDPTKTTDKDGKYLFTNVAPNDYKVKFSKNGYLDQWSDGKWNQSDGNSYRVNVGGANAKVTVPTQKLSKISNVVVTVVDKDKKQPITGADFSDYLKLYRPDGTTPVGNATNIAETGVFTFTGVYPGSYKLLLANNLLGYEQQWRIDDNSSLLGANGTNAGTFDVKPGENTNVTFVIQGAYAKGSIEGSIFREDTLAPVAGTASLYDVFGTNFIKSDTADGTTGKYQIMTVADGQYTVKFEANNFIPEWYNNVLKNTDATLVSVKDGKTTVINPTYLAAGGAIGVNVTGSGPVAGVSVWAEGVDVVFTSQTKKTDAQGKAVLRGLPAGYYTIRTDPYNQYMAYTSPSPVQVKVDETTNVDIALKTGGRITGRVTNKDGLPVAGATVQLYDSVVNASAGVMFSSSKTNSQGYYTIDGIAPGDYKLGVTAGGYLAQYYDKSADWDGGKVITVGEGIQTIDFTLEQGNAASISGRVTLPGGQSAKGVTVKLFDSQSVVDKGSATTDATGSYIIQNVEAGTYTVQFVPPASGPFASEWYNNKPTSADADKITVTKNSATKDINAELDQAPGMVSGIVKAGSAGVPTLAAEAGKPLSGVTVAVYDPATNDLVNQATTEQDGKYKIKGLREGDYKAQAQTPCSSGYAGQWYNLKPNRAAADVFTTTKTTSATANFSLYQSGISGKVFTGDNIPLPRSSISVYSLDTDKWNGCSGYWYNDNTGVYTVTLPAGSYKVEATTHSNFDQKYNLLGYGYHFDGTKLSEALPIEVGMTSVITGKDIKIRSAARITGTVMLKTTPTSPTIMKTETSPIAGARVRLFKLGDTGYSEFSTDVTGVFTATGVAAGKYQLFVIPPDRGPAAGYPSQWYDQVGSFRELAKVIEVKEGETSGGHTIWLIKSAAQQPAELTGVVVEETTPEGPTPSLASTGHVLSNIDLKLYKVDGSGQPTTLMNNYTTAADGTFKMTGIASGTYKLYVQPPSFGDNSGYAAQWYDQVKNADQAMHLVLEGGSSTAVTVTLTKNFTTATCDDKGTSGKWLCQDNVVYATKQPGLFCFRIPAGAFQGRINFRIRKWISKHKKTTLSAEPQAPTYPKNSDEKDRNVAFFFDVEAYTTETGKPISQTIKSVTMSVPYNDPGDLVYTPTNSTIITPTTMTESRLKVEFWNSTSYTTTGTTTSTKTLKPNWYDPTESPWCVASSSVECSQQVNTTDNDVLVTTNRFYQDYVLLETDPLKVYLPAIMRQTMTTTTTLR